MKRVLVLQVLVFWVLIFPGLRGYLHETGTKWLVPGFGTK